MAATSSAVPPIPTSAASPASPSTTAAAPTSAAPTSATSNAAASSAPSSSSSAPSSASSPATSAQSTSVSNTAATPIPTPAQIVTTSGGQVVTITSTSFVTSTVTPSAQASSGSNSFFSNTAAVAGVFTVVGLVVVALTVALVVNAVRRSRAEKFDRDVAEAAAEAAASSHSPFDDYSYNNTGGNGGGGGGGGGGAGGGGYGYSDNSHGTYQLPPLAPPKDVYGISEMSQYDPYAAGAVPLAVSAVGQSRSRTESETGAPGIAGVGAGTLAREPSKRAPYHAFARPAPQPQDLQASGGSFRSQRGDQDVFEAAGLAPMGSSNPNNGAGGAFVSRRPSDTLTQHTQFTGRRSQYGSMSSGGHHPMALQPGYPVESYYPQRSDSLSPDPFAGYPPVPPASKPLPNPYGPETPAPSVPGHSDHNEDVESGSPTALRSDEQRMSYQDDTDYSQGNRVLRVANE